MRVMVLPVLSDNYVFLATKNEREAIVVDPAVAPEVLEALEREGLRLVAILNTHHHFDHVGGNQAILERYPDIDVYAHRSDAQRIPGITRELEDGDTVDVADMHFDVRFVPGHTSGHIAYQGEGVAFVGDTLFAGGCGRLFEGTPQQMHHSLSTQLAALPDETRVYCAHEYTEGNLRFAQTVEPNNPALRERIVEVKRVRAQGRFTIPTQIGIERATNPFLRCEEQEIRESLGLSSGVPVEQVFAKLRAAKDRF